MYERPHDRSVVETRFCPAMGETRWDVEDSPQRVKPWTQIQINHTHFLAD